MSPESTQAMVLLQHGTPFCTRDVIITRIISKSQLMPVEKSSTSSGKNVFMST